MELKEKLVSSFMAFENTVDIDSPIHDIRIQALKHFEIEGFPTKRQEAWKYTSLNTILKHDYSVFPKHEEAGDGGSAQHDRGRRPAGRGGIGPVASATTAPSRWHRNRSACGYRHWRARP